MSGAKLNAVLDGLGDCFWNERSLTSKECKRGLARLDEDKARPGFVFFRGWEISVIFEVLSVPPLSPPPLQNEQPAEFVLGSLANLAAQQTIDHFIFTTAVLLPSAAPFARCDLAGPSIAAGQN